MTITTDISLFALVANGAYNSITANATAITAISVGGTTINSTVYAGTANNANNLNSQPGSFYTNATNITTGTLPMAQLNANVVNTSAAFTITGVHTYTANIVVGNTTVNTQLSNATILIANATSTTTLGLADLRIGNTTTNVVISNTVSSFGGNVVITGTANVTGTLTGQGSVTFSTGSGSIDIGTLQGSGTVTIGGVTQTGTIQIGRSTANQTVSIANGVTTSGNTKIVNIGTGGAAGSNTTINIGSSAGSGQVVINQNVGIGNTAPTVRLQVQGAILASDNITAYSDIRLKDDIVTISYALDKVTKLRGIEYTNRESGNRRIGVIAQEVQPIVPEVVNQNGEYLSVAYGNMVGLLIEAIKEQQAQIESLRNEIEALKTK